MTNTAETSVEVVNMERCDDADMVCDSCQKPIATGWVHTVRDSVGVQCDDCAQVRCDYCERDIIGVLNTCSTCSDDFCDDCKTSDATECPTCCGHPKRCDCKKCRPELYVRPEVT